MKLTIIFGIISFHLLFSTAKGQDGHLIRNSWGPNCDSYHKEYPCEKGVITVPANRLNPAVGELTVAK